MHESATYLMILDGGQEKRARKDILFFGIDIADIRHLVIVGDGRPSRFGATLSRSLRRQ